MTNDFVMSKFASKEDMIAAMRKRIEELELENAQLRVEIEYYSGEAE